MRVVVPECLLSNQEGQVWLTELYEGGLESRYVEFDLSNIKWIDANLRAAWAVIEAHWKEQGVSFCFVNYEGGRSFEDQIAHETCLPYRNFGLDDFNAWCDYAQQVFESKGMPDMTPAVRNRLGDGILEIFQNAREHSHTAFGIFACGHYFREQHCIRLSIADAGIGFRRRLYEALKLEKQSGAAIAWAMAGRNTVKSPRENDSPGGIGLKDLKRFVELNGGKLSVLSDAGYWEFAHGDEQICELQCSFPGALLTLTVDTMDRQSYQLRSELAS